MQLTDVFLNLGEDQFSKLVRSISIGKLKTYQLYERFKLRTHLAKLNTETLRKYTPKLWERMHEHNEEYATDISQAVLVSHLDLIIAVLNFLGIPHEEGFFVKDLDASPYLTEGWRERVFEKFKGDFPPAVVLFYINHLALEVGKAEEVFAPAA
jgi:hypothetical protein